MVTEDIATLLGGSDKVKAVKAIAIYYGQNGSVKNYGAVYRGTTYSIQVGTTGAYYAAVSVDWTNNKVSYLLGSHDGTNPYGMLVALF